MVAHNCNPNTRQETDGSIRGSRSSLARARGQPGLHNTFSQQNKTEMGRKGAPIEFRAQSGPAFSFGPSQEGRGGRESGLPGNPGSCWPMSFHHPQCPWRWIRWSVAGGLVGFGPALFSLPAPPRLGAGLNWRESGKLSGRPLHPQSV